MNDPEFYVYAYFEPEAAEPFYIGKGHGDRAWDHLKLSKRGQRTPFYKKLASLNWQAEIVILEDGLTENEANELEILNIAYFGRKDQGAGPLLNMTDGGDGVCGHRHNEETKKRISKTLLGKRFTDIHKERLSVSESLSWTEERRKRHHQQMLGNNRGKAYNDSRKRPIIAKHWGKIHRRFESITEAKKAGYATGNIHKALNGIIKTAYGYEWEYES